MSAEDFNLVNDDKIDNSDIKKDFVKFCHQHAAQIKDENQSNNFFSREKMNFIPVGNAFLVFKIKVRKADNTIFVVSGDVNTKEVIRFVNNALAFTIHDARNSTSSGGELQQNKFCRSFSTIVRLLTQREGDISTYFDIIDESEGGSNTSSLKQLLLNNHTEANRGIVKGNLPLEYFLDFVDHLKH